jgi:hypothetical protein
MNSGVKIVRLQSGEDVIATIMEDTESELVMLDNPMHLIFKRTPKGTVMMMFPWLPIELISDNIATIYSSDILTMLNPIDNLVEYYGRMIEHELINTAKDNTLNLNLREAMNDLDDEEEDWIYDDEEDDQRTAEDDELSKEEIMELVELKRTGRLH